jgi:hypothetical protein
VLVGVLLEGLLAQTLVQEEERVRGVLVVLAEDRQRLGPELGLGVLRLMKRSLSSSMIFSSSAAGPTM